MELTKSQMINRIAELSQLNAELKAYKDVNEDFKTAWEELKAENDRLKEGIKQLEVFIKSDSEIDHINHEYTYKLKTCSQEIKSIAETYLTDCQGFKCEAMEEIMQKITKAEEE